MDDPLSDLPVHHVRDNRQVIRFPGTHLATVSARRPGASRWAELSLYRLPSGSPSHVFARVGRSRVFHREACPAVSHTLPFGHEVADPDDIAPPSDLVSCTSCAPPRPRSLADDDFLTTHRFEVTRYHAAVIASPAELVGKLLYDVPHHRLPHRGGPLAGLNPRMPWLSRQLLESAAVHDPSLADAFVIDLTSRLSGTAG